MKRYIRSSTSFESASADCYRALRLGAVDSEAIIREIKFKYNLTRSEAVAAFRKAHDRYEMQQEMSDSERYLFDDM